MGRASRVKKDKPAVKPLKLRCDEVLVQCMVRAYDADGQMTDEMLTQPVKLLRSKTGPEMAGVWAVVDREVAKIPAPNGQ